MRIAWSVRLGLTAILGIIGSGQGHGQDAASEGGDSSRPDRRVYADDATARLVELARIRHRNQSQVLQSYRAQIYTKVDGKVGASRFTGGFSLFHFETIAKMQWQQPGDVRVDVLGVRSATPRVPGIDGEQMGGWWTEVLAEEPWFVPAALGDEIQLMGIPDEEALHPLARDGDRYYRYAISDSMRMSLPGREVRAIAVRVEPIDVRPSTRRGDVQRRVTVDRSARELEPDDLADMVKRLRAAEGDTDRLRELADSLGGVVSSEDGRIRISRGRRDPLPPSLVSGEMWLDADSLDVVRLIVTYVGENIWDDDPDAPELMTLETDLEYGLHLNQFWLPHRQVLAATFKYKYLPGAKLPAVAVTTFSDYEVNVDGAIRFARTLSPNVTGRRYGGRWRCEPWGGAYGGGADECGDSAFIKERVMSDGTRWEVMVPDMDSLERYDFDTEFEHTVDLASEPLVDARLARLAQLSEELPPELTGRSSGLDWLAAAQAFNFNRVQGPSLGIGYKFDPNIPFTTIHLDGRVSLADKRLTGGVRWQEDAPVGRLEVEAFHKMQDVEPWTRGLTLGNSLSALILGHDNAAYLLATGGGFSYTGNQGLFKRFTMTVRYERQTSVPSQVDSFGGGRYPPNAPIVEGDYLRARFSRSFEAGPADLQLGIDGLASTEHQGVRWWAAAQLPFEVSRLRGTLRTRGGLISGDEISQLLYRAGGPWNVRAFDYGTRRGSSVWVVQADLEWVVSQWWSPVIFGDVGNVAGFDTPLSGAGVGLSLLSGWMRLNMAKGIQPSADVRFDILFRIPNN